jgi:putative ABC transport system permease protein
MLSTGRSDAFRRMSADVWDGIRSQPRRTGLSFLAVALGMTVLSILLASLGGLQARSDDLIRELGVQVLAVLPAGGNGPDEGLNEKHAALLAANLADCRVAAVKRFQTVLPPGDRTAVVLATDDNLATVRSWPVVRGRALDARDLRCNERHALISTALRDAMGWDVGGVATIMNQPFTVVGVVEAAAGPLESSGTAVALGSGEYVVLVPRGVARTWLDRDQADRDAVDAIFVRAPEATALPRVLAASQRLLSAPDLRTGGVSWVTPAGLVRGIRRLQFTLALTLGGIAVLCVLLGGVTLASLMVASVHDRLTEIGLRRALGAEPRDIARLFVAEGALVSGAGALAGSVVAHVVLPLIRVYVPIPLRLDALTFILPIGLAVILGLAFSYVPARRAARIAPAEALRSQ